MTLTTKEKLAWTAAKLFQEKGYNGVGLSEILKATGLPKGSLYHHFPNGKSDLAMEAAALAHREMSRIIDEAFLPANNYGHGRATLFHKLAKLFEIMGNYTGCPISDILFAGPDHVTFRETSKSYFEAWIDQIAAHAIRLGESADTAEARGRQLFIVLQGGWTLARAQQNSDVLRDLAEMQL